MYFSISAMAAKQSSEEVATRFSKSWRRAVSSAERGVVGVAVVVTELSIGEFIYYRFGAG